MKKYLRGAIHCHSRYSFDCATSIQGYLRAAARLNLDFIVLTDHDTAQGSLALRDAAAKAMPHLQVPMAAEYKTDEGDIIAAFLNAEMRERQFDLFVREAQVQGAMLLLPHPFVGHKHPEKLAPHCHLIEVFNSRASKEANDLARDLARLAAKSTYAAPDSHFLRSLGKALLEVEDMGDLRTSLLRGEIRFLLSEPTSRWETGASQLIKAWKIRSLRLAYRMVRGGLRRVARLSD